jgi:ubiquinone/menaquinone biosynthesis C-methylase UbiE
MAHSRKLLTDTEFTENYYHEHAAAGLDYLSSGNWHLQYAHMVCEVTLQQTYKHPAMLDVGCACGALIEGFRRSYRVRHCYGIDVNEYMVKLGRDHFGFSDGELFIGSAANVPLPDGSLSLINSGQVLEHIPDTVIPSVFKEFMRLLRPGGRMFHNLAALKHGNPPNVHDGDPTHVNIKPVRYWAEEFMKAGFLPDFESFERFARAPQSPGGDFPSFFQTYPSWTTFTLIKP